jgi:hypothetical protein
VKENETKQCELCGREVHGELGVFDFETERAFVISIEETSPRDWILCDSCNTLVCHDCCRYPASGYCDACLSQYHLFERLVAMGLIVPHTEKR